MITTINPLEPLSLANKWNVALVAQQVVEFMNSDEIDSFHLLTYISTIVMFVQTGHSKLSFAFSQNSKDKVSKGFIDLWIV